MNVKRIFAAALLSGSLAAAGIGVGAGTAVAVPSGPHVWCPGDSINHPTGPGAGTVWDMNVCHTWWWVKYGFGNVQTDSGWVNSILFDGENPPPGAVRDCGLDLFGFPIHC